MGISLPGFSFPPPPDPARMEAVDGEPRYTPNPQFRMWLAQMYNWTTKLGNNASGSITANAFTAGTSPNWTNIDASGIWAGGANFAASPFSVSMAGALTATSGTIAGWTLGATTISKNNAILDSAGQLVLGTTNDVVYLSATDATYRLWIGNATAASAKFTVTKGGDVSILGGGIFNTTGYIQATGDVSSGTYHASMVANSSYASANGLVGYSSNSVGGLGYSGVTGIGMFSGASGVVGITSTSGAIGMLAYHTLGGSELALSIGGKTSTNGQIASTLATGTAPFVIASTTQVANLNVATSGACSGNAATATNVAGTGLTGTSLASGIVSSALTSVGTLTDLSVNMNTTITFKNGSSSNAVTFDNQGNINAGCSLGTGIYYCQNTAGATGTITPAGLTSVTVKGGIITAWA